MPSVALAKEGFLSLSLSTNARLYPNRQREQAENLFSGCSSHPGRTMAAYASGEAASLSMT